MRPRPLLVPNRRKAQKPERPAGHGQGARLGPRLRKIVARTASVGLGVIVAAGVAAMLVTLGLFLKHYITRSEHFQIETIKVTGQSRVTRDEVLKAGGVEAGRNIFAVDMDEAQRRIAGLAWVRRASVGRKLPASVSIHIEERNAQALIDLGGLYLVDGEGEIFKGLGENDPADLPIITGLTRQVVIDHPHGAQQAIRDALGLIAEYKDAGLEARASLSEVHRLGALGWSLVISDPAIDVRLGQGPYRSKLRRLAHLLHELGRRSMRAQYIYLDNRVRGDRATVKLREPEPAERPFAAQRGEAVQG